MVAHRKAGYKLSAYQGQETFTFGRTYGLLAKDGVPQLCIKVGAE